MSPLVLLGVGVLGGLGSAGRFLLDGAVSVRLTGAFPYGTLAVNATGSLALGVVAGATLDPDSARLLSEGLIGGYTTFSTWAFESQRLVEDGRRVSAGLNLIVSLIVGLGAAWLGRKAGLVL